jgi:ArsR family transcriptional regulator, arsenate/arsenite/antimonite-responsive transcriptional repressor / arsenate reductase (thioredoxin)
MDVELLRRAELHAALGDPHRLAIVDELSASDRSPSELKALLDVDSNLLAHHLGVLEHLGVVERVASQGDQRRRYARLIAAPLARLQSGRPLTARRIVFVCTENAARSRLAQAVWNHVHPVAATSAGTAPADHLHPGTIAVAARRGLALDAAHPRPLPVLHPTDLVITVCDRAHESLPRRPDVRQLHWSIPDPTVSATADAYDQTVDALESRITAFGPNIQAA